MRALRHTGSVLVVLAAIAACATDTASDAAPDGGDDGGGDDRTPGSDADVLPPADTGIPDARPDVFEPPLAKGDPCRGIPLPADQHFVAAGMCARLVARDLPVLRQITFAPNGDLFGVDLDGSVRMFRDDDGDGFFQPNEIHAYASTGGNGNNCHVDAAGGFLYCGSPTGVVRFAYVPPATTAAGAAEDVVVGQPSDGHPLHTTHVYGGYLYVHSGSSSDASGPATPEYDTDRSLLRRFALASFTPGTPFQWSTGEVVTVGLRNLVGYTQNAAGRMFGVVNGIDSATYQLADVHDDNPGEQVVELALGRKYGFPFCWTAQRVVTGGVVLPAGTQVADDRYAAFYDDAKCATASMKPATFVQAHSAPLDILFFDVQPKGVLPERWRGGAFITFHGSMSRTTTTGYKVVWMPFDAAGNPPMPTSTATETTFPYETVLGGPADGKWTWSDGTNSEAPRFVGIAVSPVDGALYISSDLLGYVYRVGLPK